MLERTKINNRQNCYPFNANHFQDYKNPTTKCHINTVEGWYRYTNAYSFFLKNKDRIHIYLVNYYAMKQYIHWFQY